MPAIRRRHLVVSNVMLLAGLAVVLVLYWGCGGGGGGGDNGGGGDDSAPPPAASVTGPYQLTRTTALDAPDPAMAPAEAMAVADFNSDGRRDLLVPLSRLQSDDTSPLPVRPLYVDGQGELRRQENGLVVDTGWVQDANVGDFNGDGTPDVLFGDHGVELAAGQVNPGATNKLFLGDSAGLVAGPSSEGINGDVSFWHSTRVADIDDDGDVDVVAVNTQVDGTSYPEGEGRGLQVFENDGSGRFTRRMDWVPADADATVDGARVPTVVALAELTGDAYPELIAGFAQDFGDPGQRFDTRIYEGSASGFADTPLRSIPRPPESAIGHPPEDYFTDKIHTGDLNGDGRTDLVVYYADFADHGHNLVQLLYQQEDGSFTDRTPAALGGYELVSPRPAEMPKGGASVEVVDVNNDGLPDLHWTFDLVQVPENWEPTVFLNEGDGTFARLAERAPGTLADAVAPRGSLNWARFRDADGDGRTDLLFQEAEQPEGTLVTRFGLLRRVDSVLEHPDTDDTITGTPFPDTIRAGGGDDLIEGGLGGDTIRGGPGTDTAVFPGARAEYSVAGGTTSATVTGRGVTDRLEGVEHLRFSDTREPLPAGSVE